MTIATDIERYMLELINQERAAHGLNALTLEMNLNDAADGHSQWMTDNDTFSHDSYDGSFQTVTYHDRIVDAQFDLGTSWWTGENIAARSVGGAEGYYDEIDALHAALMNSQYHRENILSENFTHVGIGFAFGPLTYSNGVYDSILITQNFGASNGALDLDILGSALSEGIDGGAGTDFLQGAGGADMLSGFGQNDTLRGGEGADVVDGGTGNDRAYGDAGDDTVSGATGDDHIFGGSGRDQLNGDAGNDRMSGDGGHDTLDGGSGNDTMSGGVHADLLLGGSGDDSLSGDAGADRLFGGDGDDTLDGGDQIDILHGQNDDDHLSGGAGNDRHFGGGGNDVIDGGDGRDFLSGGAGFDTLTAGAGDDYLRGDLNGDTFVFADISGGFGNDVIRDFHATSVSERIDFSGLSTFDSFADLTSNHMWQQGSDVMIHIDANSSILLENVALANLDASDFIF